MNNNSMSQRCICPHCGMLLEADEPIIGMQVSCPGCGGDFVATPVAPEPTAAPTEVSTPHRHGKKWILGAAVLVVLVVLVVLKAGLSSKGLPPGKIKTIKLPGEATMDMVWCPPGTFTMGRPEGEEWREPRNDGDMSWEGFKNTLLSPYNLHKPDADELELLRVWGFPEGENDREDWEKQHSVTLTKGFWMAKTEVTQAQWISVMGNNPSKQRDDDRLPVGNVSWDDCVQFCQKAGLQLPTEAQWEYACRAGSEEAYGGTGYLDDMGWYRDNCEEIQPVGQKLPNAWGLYDMHGNVEEWCSDFSDIHMSYSSNAVTNPTGPKSGKTRIIRGGSVFRSKQRCRSAFRFNEFPAAAGTRGFRPIMTP